MKPACILCLVLFLLPACGGNGEPGDPCVGVDCSGHGTCNDDGGKPKCSCEFGYKVSEDGTECIEGEAGPCKDITCSDHGRCRVDGQDQPYCECDPGWFHTEDGLDCIENNCTVNCGSIGCCGTRCCRPVPSNVAQVGELTQTGITKTASGSFHTEDNCTTGSALGDCEEVLVPGAPDLCVCRLDELRITGSLRLTGPNLLTIIAWTSIAVDGTIDMSAARDQPGAGAAEAAAPANSWLGGAGGTLGTLGGGGTARGDMKLVPLMGGQDGQEGCGSTLAGGGAGGIQLTAGETLTFSGAIHANGGGGDGGAASDHPEKCSGGGGGGSGGGILLEARTVTATGTIWAHGGGGGGGGNNRGATGGDGADATCTMTPAGGGAGRDGASCPLYEGIEGGDGGAGAVGDNPGGVGEAPDQNMCDPDQPFVGGGGGGGGAGRIRINASDPCNCTGSFSPSHTTGPLQGG